MNRNYRFSYNIVKIIGVVLFFVLTIFTMNNKTINADNSNNLLSSKYITNFQMQDSSGNAKNNFGIDDPMKLNANFDIPADQIKNGDKFVINVPDKLTFNFRPFAIKDEYGNEIGNITPTKQPGQISVNFDKIYNASKNENGHIVGNFNFDVHWDKSKVKDNTGVPININVNGMNHNINVHINQSTLPSGKELLYKWSFLNWNNTIIHWRVRLNYGKQNINNAKYTDTIGPNQALVPGSVSPQDVEYDSNGNYKTLDTIKKPVIDNHNGSFTINLGNINKTIIVDYATRILDNGSSNKYYNNANLTGYDINPQYFQANTGDINGGGSADIYNEVSGVKYWDDDSNKNKQRPQSININLLANGKKIQTKTITQQNGWQYDFSKLPKYDDHKNYINYTVNEDSVPNYKTEIHGNNIINTLKSSDNSSSSDSNNNSNSSSNNSSNSSSSSDSNNNSNSSSNNSSNNSSSNNSNNDSNLNSNNNGDNNGNQTPPSKANNSSSNNSSSSNNNNNSSSNNLNSSSNNNGGNNGNQTPPSGINSSSSNNNSSNYNGNSASSNNLNSSSNNNSSNDNQTPSSQINKPSSNNNSEYSNNNSQSSNSSQSNVNNNRKNRVVSNQANDHKNAQNDHHNNKLNSNNFNNSYITPNSNSSSYGNTHKQKLPQTGEKNHSVIYVIIGILFIGLGISSYTILKKNNK